MLISTILILSATVLGCDNNSCDICSNNECIKCVHHRYFDSFKNCCNTSNCFDCSSDINYCKSCLAGFFLKNSFCCPENCLSCTLDSYCLECREGFTAKNGLCMKCPDNCSSCDMNSFCFACYEEYVMDAEGPCIALPSQDYKSMILALCFGFIVLFVSGLYLLHRFMYILYKKRPDNQKVSSKVENFSSSELNCAGKNFPQAFDENIKSLKQSYLKKIKIDKCDDESVNDIEKTTNKDINNDRTVYKIKEELKIESGILAQSSKNNKGNEEIGLKKSLSIKIDSCILKKSIKGSKKIMSGLDSRDSNCTDKDDN